MRKDNPCVRECPHRSGECHSSCPDYKTYYGLALRVYLVALLRGRHVCSGVVEPVKLLLQLRALLGIICGRGCGNRAVATLAHKTATLNGLIFRNYVLRRCSKVSEIFVSASSFFVLPVSLRSLGAGNTGAVCDSSIFWQTAARKVSEVFFSTCHNAAFLLSKCVEISPAANRTTNFLTSLRHSFEFGHSLNLRVGVFVGVCVPYCCRLISEQLRSREAHNAARSGTHRVELLSGFAPDVASDALRFRSARVASGMCSIYTFQTHERTPSLTLQV